jgi:hypothetical protein
MRAIALAAAAALALSACGRSNQTDANQAADDGMTADSIVSNDVTAIDAVTGDAANMAADVNYQDFGNGADETGDSRPGTAPSRPASTTNGAKPRQPDEPAAASPVANTTGNGAG